MNYSDTQIKILQYLRSHYDGATGKEIAAFCKVSLNTIRREFSSMFDQMNENSFYIDSKPSYGYRLIVLDEKKTGEFFQNLIIKSNNPLFENNKSQNYKVNFIIRYLLTNEDFVPLNKLAKRLMYSESSVRRDLKIVEEELNNYNLKLKQKKNHGLYIDGEELNKRICLISQHKLFVNLDSSLQEQESGFISTFSIGDMSIRQCILKIKNALYKETKFVYKLIDFPIIYYYIPVIKARNKYSQSIVISELQMKVLKKSKAIDKAKELLALIKDVIEVNEKEVIAFAMLLLAYRSVTNISQLESYEIDALNQEAEKLIHFVDERFFISDEMNSSNWNSFICILSSVLNKLLFHVIPDKENYRTFSKTKPFVEDLCMYTCKGLEKQLNQYVNYNLCLPFYYFYNYLFEKKMESVKKLKIALVSTYGIEYGQYCRINILENYKKYIKDIETLEYSQLNERNSVNYDYILTDMRLEMFPKTFKNKYLFLEKQSDENQYVRSLSNKIDELIEDGKNQIMYFGNTNGNSIEEVIHNISMELDSTLEESLMNRLYYRCPQNHEYTLYLVGQSKTINQGTYFYHLEKEIKVNGKTIDQIVFSVYDKQNYSTIFFINHLLCY